MNGLENIARILRTDKDYLKKIEKRLGAATGRKSVFEKIYEENAAAILRAKLVLGLDERALSEDVFQALLSKTAAQNDKLKVFFEGTHLSDSVGVEKILERVRSLVRPRKGFFLKEEKARQFLEKEPPMKVMEYLGYGSVQELLRNEDLREVFSALRFVEGSEWLNKVFFKQYEELKSGDFETREIELKVMPDKWDKAAEGFLRKKWHNVSHLKELGVIFVIPKTFGVQGELLRLLCLVFHYLNEVSFYSDMFLRIARDRKNFAGGVVSLLRGDVTEEMIREGRASLWYVVQRYLAKDDEYDWRLFAPHINPEAMHWQRAENDLAGVFAKRDGFSVGLDFWSGLGWVGDYMMDRDDNEILTSFDMVDSVMSLVMKKERVKYLYHQQEALWNKIFSEYFGKGSVYEFSKKNLLKGYFEV